MMKFLIVCVTLVSLLSSSLKAMLVDDSYCLDKAVAEIIFIIVSEWDVDLIDIGHFCCTKKELSKIFADEGFWQRVYANRFGPKKLNPDSTYKENFKHKLKAYPRPVVVFSSGSSGTPSNYSKFPGALPNRYATGLHKITYEEIRINAPTLASSDVKNIWKLALKKEPRVFCTVFNLADDEIPIYLRNIFDEAKTKNILLILPAGYAGRDCDGQDLHKAYPNVLWVATHKNKQLALNSNFGSLVTIAAESSYGDVQHSCATMLVGEFAGYLLRLDPSLTAEELHRLIRDNAWRDDAIAKKIPVGGILDRGETIRALKRSWQNRVD